MSPETSVARFGKILLFGCNFRSLAIFWRSFYYSAKIWTYFGHFSLFGDKFSMLQKAKHWKNNPSTWLHKIWDQHDETVIAMQLTRDRK